MESLLFTAKRSAKGRTGVIHFVTLGGGLIHPFIMCAGVFTRCFPLVMDFHAESEALMATRQVVESAENSTVRPLSQE